MTLLINGKPQDHGPEEHFPAHEEPLTGGPVDPPEQLELEPPPKKPGTFTKKAKALIGRSGKKIRGGGKC
jgi:hypothetical protein